MESGVRNQESGGEKNRSQSTVRKDSFGGRLAAESEIRSQEVWNACAIWLEISYFAQAKSKIRVIFEAFLNDFERFFAKIDAFRTIFCNFERKLSGFLQVRGRDCVD